MGAPDGEQQRGEGLRLLEAWINEVRLGCLRGRETGAVLGVGTHCWDHRLIGWSGTSVRGTCSL